VYLTFGQLQSQDSRLSQVINECGSSNSFRSLVNQAVELLLNRGDWRGTLAPIYVCVANGCVTWPRYVHSVRKLNVCNREVTIGNIWSQFIERDFYGSLVGDNYWNIVRPLTSHDRFREMDALGYYSTYNDVPSISNIVVFSDNASDAGKTVTIFGKDLNGQPLSTVVAGVPQDGLIITIAPSGGVSSIALSPGPIRVIKQTTQGNVRLLSQDVASGNYLDLAFYAPSETTPQYTRYRLHGRHGCWNGSANLPQPYGVTALVKLEYIPVIATTDLVLIGNIEALKLAVQGVQKRESGDPAAGKAFITEAVDALNSELRNEQLNDQIPIQFKTYGPERKQRVLGRYY
jgi:hypothetical protein